MPEIINLRARRRARDRAAREVEAAANRALHGRTRAERARDETVARERRALVDGAKLDRPPTDGETR